MITTTERPSAARLHARGACGPARALGGLALSVGGAWNLPRQLLVPWLLRQLLPNMVHL